MRDHTPGYRNTLRPKKPKILDTYPSRCKCDTMVENTSLRIRGLPPSRCSDGLVLYTFRVSWDLISSPWATLPPNSHYERPSTIGSRRPEWHETQTLGQTRFGCGASVLPQQIPRRCNRSRREADMIDDMKPKPEVVP